MLEKFYCSNCGVCAQRTSNNQKYCKSCAHTIHLLKMRLNRKHKREEELFSCHMRKKSDGTPDFDQEEKDIKQLLKYYGLRK